MTGSTISIIVLTIAIALFAAIIAFIISSILSANKIATDNRMDHLKKTEGAVDDIALVKNESRRSKREKTRKERERKNGLFEKLGNALYKQLQSADIKMRPEEFLIIWVLVVVLPGPIIAPLVPTMKFLPPLLVVAGLVAPYIVIKMKQKNRVKQFDVQLSDALMIACSSLKSGLSFTQAMEAIATDMPAPISTEFRLVLNEMNMGISMDEALERLNQRIKSQYLPLMVSAVLIQKQTGGNLSSILETIADAIKQKMKLKQELKASTASGRSTGLMVGSMPVVLLVLFYLVNREFIMPLFTDPKGKYFLIAAAVLEALCAIAVKKITNVKM